VESELGIQPHPAILTDIVEAADLQRHQTLLPEVDRLRAAMLLQVPEVQSRSP